MSKYYYDVHIHSCLSPCGDNDMTPNNIAGMAALKGLQIVALTDHNSCKNCRAFYAACKRQGLVPIAGMELTTSEDIHLVCLFRSLEDAEAFDGAVDGYRVKYPNRTDIFGDQLICNCDDEIIGTEPDLLPNATGLSLEEGTALARKMGGFAYPAHIDRESNGILAILGSLPDSPRFSFVEYRDREHIESYRTRYSVNDRCELVCSDAHYLWDISEAENSVELDDDPYSSDLIRNRFFDFLESKNQ